MLSFGWSTKEPTALPLPVRLRTALTTITTDHTLTELAQAGYISNSTASLFRSVGIWSRYSFQSFPKASRHTYVDYSFPSENSIPK